MTNRIPANVGKLRERGEYRALRQHLLHLQGRVRDCRDLSRAAQSAFVALSLAELANRLEAEAALVAAKADLAARLEAIAT